LAVNFRNVLYGLASGYVLKGIQFLISLLMIPFLLSDEILGVTGYGQVATLLAVNGLLLVVTDGVRVSQSRTIARSVDTDSQNGKIVGSCAQIIAIVAAPISLSIILFSEYVSDLAGLPRTYEMDLSIKILGVIYLLENIFSVPTAALHAIGRTYMVNTIMFSEVILRSACLFLIFTFSRSSVLMYMQIYFSVLILKHFSFLFMVKLYKPSFFSGLSAARPTHGLSTLLYSFPVLANSLGPALLYKGSVVIVNKFAGSDAAAFLSILVITIRNYIVQLTYGSLHPMMVPLAARVHPDTLSENQRKFISESFRFYALGVFAFCFGLSAFALEFLLLWLGTNYTFLSLALQGFLFSTALDLSASPIRSFLIAHGHASRLFRLTLPVGLICFVGMFASVAFGAQWEVVIVFIMIFSIASSGLIANWVFATEFPSLFLGFSRFGWLARAIAASALGFAAWGASRISAGLDNAPAGTALSLIAITVSVIVVSHYLILDMKSAKEFGSNLVSRILREKQTEEEI